MYYPLLEEARILAASGAYRRIPVSRELLSDFITPIQALRTLRAQSGHCFLLESAADSAGWGRYTFLGFDPTLAFPSPIPPPRDPSFRGPTCGPWPEA